MELTEIVKQDIRNEIEEHGLPEVEVIDDILTNGNKLVVFRPDKNPVGNHYYPIHLKEFLTAIEKGFIIPGVTHIIDTSSSNSGISLAKVAKIAQCPIKIYIPRELESQVMDYTVKKILQEGGVPAFPDAQIYGNYKYLRACAEALGNDIKQLQTENISGLKQHKYFILNHSRLYETEEAGRDMFMEALRRSGAPIPDYLFNINGNGLTALMWNELKEKFGTKIITIEPLTSGLMYQMKVVGKDAYNLVGEGPMWERFGMNSGALLTTVPGSNPGGTATGRSVKMPLVNAAVMGGKVYGLKFNQAMVEGDRETMKEAMEDSRIYKPVVDEVMMFADEKILKMYEENGGDSDQLREEIEKSTDLVLYDKTREILLENGFDVGMSSAAVVAGIQKYIDANNIKNATFGGIWYDNNDKYRLPGTDKIRKVA